MTFAEAFQGTTGIEWNWTTIAIIALGAVLVFGKGDTFLDKIKSILAYVFPQPAPAPQAVPQLLPMEPADPRQELVESFLHVRDNVKDADTIAKLDAALPAILNGAK